MNRRRRLGLSLISILCGVVAGGLSASPVGEGGTPEGAWVVGTEVMPGDHFIDAGESPAEAFTLSEEIRAALLAVGPDQELLLRGFPVLPGHRQPLLLSRVEVYARGARIWAVDGGAEPRRIPRSRRLFFRATSPGDPTLLAGLSVDPESGAMRGRIIDALGTREILPPDERDWRHRVRSTRRDPHDARFDLSCGSEALPMPVEVQERVSRPVEPFSRPLESISPLPRKVANTPAYQAVVAVDTDNEFHHLKFGNNLEAATDWLADLFLQMNVMYERDLSLRLLQGETYLRRDLDPSPTYDDDPWEVETAFTNINHLNEFGNYWSANLGSVKRVFAMLLSGKLSGGASGIAWLNGYCSSFFGYSVTQVSGSLFLDTNIVGHELGHNFGSPHTHCYRPEIHQCWASESGCYAGETSCPSTGSGSVMSYCHLNGCGFNRNEFHDRVIGNLSGFIANRSPSCIEPFSNPADIFDDGFESGSMVSWSSSSEP